jgi:hypothetical protein
MMDEGTWFMYALGVLGATGAGMAAYLNTRVTKSHDDLSEQIGKSHDDLTHQIASAVEKANIAYDKAKDNALDLANFRTDAAKDFAKEVNVQASLARIHDTMEKGFTEIRTDIKQLIRLEGK